MAVLIFYVRYSVLTSSCVCAYVCLSFQGIFAVQTRLLCLFCYRVPLFNAKLALAFCKQHLASSRESEDML